MSEKQRIRQIFGKLVDPVKLESLLAGPLQREPLAQGRIEFVLALVGGGNPDEISGLVGRVADIASAHGAVVQGMIGPLVSMAFGMHPISTIKPGCRISLVNELHQQLAGHIKIIHGAADGHYGLIGSCETTLLYSFLLPQFEAVLGALIRLEFGQTEEFTP
jgi:hypothetical protein